MSKKIQTPFSIDKWKKGAKVETRGGMSARILCTDIKCMHGYDYPIAAAIGNGEYEHVHVFTEEGRYKDGCEDEFDLVIVKEVEEPERWADDEEAIGEGWWITANAGIKRNKGMILNRSNNFNLFSQEKQAKSALAMARISQLLANDERYGGVVTDEEWGCDSAEKFTLERFYNSIKRDVQECYYCLLAFHTEEQRDLFLEENEELVKQYLMIN